MRSALLLLALVFVLCGACGANAQNVDVIRDDQIDRLADYILNAIQPSGLVRDSLVLNGNSFHPATPDAAGFALLALSAFDELGKVSNADQLVEDILSAHVGQTTGVTPARSTDGHFIHFMNIDSGVPAGGGWDASYSPISSALLVAGAQFAENHFSGNTAIASLVDQLTLSVDFDAAIHPSLDGRIFLDMTSQGGGSGGTVRPWNEYMLVESLALQQADNHRAVAVKDQWLNVDNLPKIGTGSFSTLTDSPGRYAPAFWVQQMHFFNGDFRHSPEFETFFNDHQQVDQLYSGTVLGEAFRYGLTAGVSPNGYHADRIGDHPEKVFSPEAVAAWGDIDTLLQFHAQQPPTSDPSYQYGFVRESAEQPNWKPFDAGVVDHTFLLFGLIESLLPEFFAERVSFGLVTGDYNFDDVIDAADFTVWRDTLGSTVDLRADGDLNGSVGMEDYVLWKERFADSLGAATTLVPEPSSRWWLVIGAFFVCRRRRISLSSV